MAKQVFAVLPSLSEEISDRLERPTSIGGFPCGVLFLEVMCAQSYSECGYKQASVNEYVPGLYGHVIQCCQHVVEIKAG